MQEKVIDQAFVIFFFSGKSDGQREKKEKAYSTA